MSVKLIHNKTSYTFNRQINRLGEKWHLKQSLVNFKSKDEINRSIYKVTLGSDNLDSLITILYNPFTKEERKTYWLSSEPYSIYTLRVVTRH